MSASLFLEIVRILPLVVAHGRATIKAVKEKAINEMKRSSFWEFSCIYSLVKLQEWAIPFQRPCLQRDDEDEQSPALSSDWKGTDGGYDANEKKTALLKGSGGEQETRGKFYTAHLFGILLDVAEKEKSAKLRSAALETITAWCNFLKDREILIQFLPGIISTVAKVLLKSSGQTTESGRVHSSIVVSGYRVVTTLVCRCFASSPAPEENSSSSSRELVDRLTMHISAEQVPDVNPLNIALANNTDKLISTLRLIFNTSPHASWRARMSIMQSAFDIAFECCLLSSLVSYLDDPVPEVRQSCLHSLHRLSLKVSAGDDTEESSISGLSRFLLDSFENVLMDLTSVLMDDVGLNEERKISALQRAIGYILVIGKSGVQQTIYSVFGKFIILMMKALHKMKRDYVFIQGFNSKEVDYYVRDAKVSQLPDTTHGGFAGTKGALESRGFKAAKRKDSTTNAEVIENDDASFCVALCPSHNVDGTFDLKPRSGTSATHAERLALRALVQVYCIADTNRSTASSQSVASLDGSDRHEIASTDLLSQYLFIEGIGLAALALSMEFSPLLIDTLYLIIEKAGSHTEVIRLAAIRTLKVIAYTCGLYEQRGEDELISVLSNKVETEALSHLVCNNIDYLVNEITYRLHYLGQNTASPRMLVACLRLGGTSILPYFSDALFEISSSIDEYRTDKGLVFELLRVFDELTEIVLVASDKELKSQESQPAMYIRNLRQGEEERTSAESQNEEILDFFRKRDEIDAFDAALIEKTTGEEGLLPEDLVVKDVDGDKSETLTPTQKLFLEPAEGIISKAQYLLYIDHPHVRSLALRVLSKSINAFRDCFPERLNPIIHRLWPVILNRLADSEHFVVLEALHLTKAIIAGGKDFMSKRLSNDLLPKCLNILQELGRDIKRRLSPNANSNMPSLPKTYSESSSEGIRRVRFTSSTRLAKA
ncbi:hypothetical protein BC829DRAFT_438819 [Chytridium lagenaria]|nr:hypothetical protein BC829DRAFT_438819 [Chytridium lagenaria]